MRGRISPTDSTCCCGRHVGDGALNQSSGGWAGSRGVGLTGGSALGGSAVRQWRRGPEHPQHSGDTERGPGLGPGRTQAAQVRSTTVPIKDQCGTTSRKNHIAGKQEHPKVHLTIHQ